MWSVGSRHHCRLCGMLICEGCSIHEELVRSQPRISASLLHMAVSHASVRSLALFLSCAKHVLSFNRDAASARNATLTTNVNPILFAAKLPAADTSVAGFQLMHGAWPPNTTPIPMIRTHTTPIPHPYHTHTNDTHAGTGGEGCEDVPVVLSKARRRLPRREGDRTTQVPLVLAGFQDDHAADTAPQGHSQRGR
jgi:hypothetical protein